MRSGAASATVLPRQIWRRGEAASLAASKAASEAAGEAARDAQWYAASASSITRSRSATVAQWVNAVQKGR